MLLLKSGDIETNQDHKRFSFIKYFHWNLNGIAAHNFVKIPMTESSITSHNIGIIYLSGTFLGSSTETSDSRINMNVYSLLLVAHPSNTQCGGVFMYYKGYLPVFRRTDLSHLRECLLTKMTVFKEKYLSTPLCRSRSEKNELETFYSDLNFILSKINKFNVRFVLMISTQKFKNGIPLTKVIKPGLH